MRASYKGVPPAPERPYDPPMPTTSADPPATLDLVALDRLMRHAAARAAAFIADRAATRGTLTWEHKGPADFVSEVDVGAEQRIREALLVAYPDAHFVGEESYDPSAGLGPGLGFVADPLDGTTNFLHGFPWYAVSIGATFAGTPIAGVVHNAATGEVFSATHGGGAVRRTRPDAAPEPIAVSSTADPARALIGTGFPFKNHEEIPAYSRQFAVVTRATAGIRRAGSAALDLCDVACGRFDAFWELNLSPWDLAAGLVIIREAGGVVTTPTGAEATVSHNGLCTGSPAMHRWLLDVLQSA
ncbi:inositol monophosphatase [Gemmatimonadetes bacterium T265]|nr:inositol monophosphatase [Gemmatimonadetes bacterium T265]